MVPAGCEGPAIIEVFARSEKIAYIRVRMRRIGARKCGFCSLNVKNCVLAGLTLPVAFDNVAISWRLE